MANFDDLRRQAERALGEDTVRRLEREITSHQKPCDDGVKIDRMFSVEKVDFSTVQPLLSQLHNEVTGKAPLGRVDQTPPPDLLNVPARVQPPTLSASPHVPAQDQITLQVQHSHSARLIGAAIWGEYIYGALGVILGLSCVLGGIILGLRGVTGSTSWTASVLGLESKISDAAPGVVLFIVGIFLVWITKPKVKLKDLKG